tara:strand:- start:1899 stop:2465 length:567 start_codon:yes stop_codon:yes gene_type:complete
MDRKKKIYIGLGIVAVGVFLFIVLRKRKPEFGGNLPQQNSDGTFNPNDGGQPQTAESQLEQGNPNEIKIGDFITPYNEFARVRTSTEIDDGLFDNWYEEGALDDWGMENDGKVYSGNIIGQVTNIIPVGANVWYSVDVCAIVDGVYDSVANVQAQMAQDSCNAPIGYVIQSITTEDGSIVPNVKKVNT